MTVGDPTLGQIIGGKFQRHPVTSHDSDAVPAEPSRHHRKNDFPGIEFNGKHSGPELLDYLTHYFDRVFFWQIIRYIKQARSGLQIAPAPASLYYSTYQRFCRVPPPLPR